MLCGVKFCGGCNPRYDRGEAYERIKLYFADESKNRAGASLRFDYAKEDVPYDVLLVIGGCPACCASYDQYSVKGSVLKMWEEEQLLDIVEKLKI